MQNVKSFGTEGREKLDPENPAFVAPQDGIHAYLLFRGCDIKDLHVHEQQPGQEEQPKTTAAAASAAPAAAAAKKDDVDDTANKAAAAGDAKSSAGTTTTTNNNAQQRNNNNTNAWKGGRGSGGRGSGGGGRGGGGRTTNMVGSGASLLNRKARGTVEGGLGPENPVDGDFDFQAKLEEFDGDDGDDDADEAGDDPGAAYGTFRYFVSVVVWL